ncbi:MAG: hypothetical protein L0Z54_01355 [Thermoplasmata archaeon]|nr:hypothetical protein [Thermoplasmata archaeon]
MEEPERNALRLCIGERSSDGKIRCAAALAIARECSVPPSVVGKEIDSMGIRIVGCQLGCFP